MADLNLHHININITCSTPPGPVDGAQLEAVVMHHVQLLLETYGITPKKYVPTVLDVAVSIPKVRWFLDVGPDHERVVHSVVTCALTHKSIANYAGLKANNPIAYRILRNGHLGEVRFLLEGHVLSPEPGDVVTVIHLV